MSGGDSQLHSVQHSATRVPTYESPASLEAALELLATHRERARVIAGGTDLLLELDRGVTTDVDVLVDLTRIEGLDAIHEAKGRIHLGPLVTHNQAATSPLVRAKAQPLAQACLEIGSPALRNRATVVGNVVTASPANDSISALAALDADISMISPRGIRTVPLGEFHLGVRQTVLEPDELVTGISFPALLDGARSRFVKLGLRKAQAISVVHLAAVVTVDDSSGVVTDARLALGSVAPTIVRLADVEAGLTGSALDHAAITAAAQAAAAAVQPIDDLRAPGSYRTDQIEVMVRRTLQALAAVRADPTGADSSTDPTSTDHTSTSPTSTYPTLGGPFVAADGRGHTKGAGDTITTTLNGTPQQGQWSPVTLLDWLRDEAGSTGTKEGCAEGECGACTVTLDGVAVLSCLVPAGRADGARVVTIEGLADGDVLHATQQAFIDASAVQCGYCIPGFVVAAAALGDEIAEPTAEQMKLGLSGNLCRCTGYYPMETAVQLAAGRRS